MNKKLAILFVLFHLSLFTLAQNDKEKIILQLHERKFTWMVNQQVDSLAAMMDDSMLYVHSNGWVQTKTEMMDDLRSQKLVMKNVEVTQARVRFFKHMAIVNGQGLFKFVLAGKEGESKLMYTEVYIQRKKQWLLVSRHANKL
jgi:hypothetical protein